MNQQFSRSGSRWIAIALLMLSTQASAADSNEHLNAQEIGRPDYLPAMPDEAFRLPPVPVSPELLSVPNDQGSLRLGRVVFSGNTVVATADLEAVAAPYVGRTISVAELEDLRQRLTRHYIDLGYVNSGVLLENENLTEGKPHSAVYFKVIEGQLTAIRLRGMEGLTDDYIAYRLHKDADGPLNMEILRERYQLLLGDPLFQRLNARLIPDARLGQAILDVDVVRAQPYQLTLFANNYRPPSIGSESLGVSGWLRNLTGQGDFLEASVQTPHNSVADSRASLAWRMPLGQRGTVFSAEIDHGRSSVIEEPMQVLDIRSVLDTRDFGVSQALVETLRHKFVLGINHVNRENRTSLLGTPFSFNPGEPDGVTKEALWRFWQEYTYRSEAQVLALRSTFTAGRNNLQDIPGLPETSAASTPQKQYRIWLGQAQFARQVLENGAQAIIKGSLQRTSDRLLSLDGMSIGGVNTVRGFRENQLIRDQGETFTLEFDYPLIARTARDLNISLIPFYDHGRGYNRHEAAVTLSSCGLASRIRWQGLSLDIAFAKRLSVPDAFKCSKATLQDRGLHCSLSYRFD